MEVQQLNLSKFILFLVVLLALVLVGAVSAAAQAQPVASTTAPLQSALDLQGGSVTKTVIPTGKVGYGDELTYTLVISAAPGVQVGLYDPLTDTTFTRFVEQPAVGVVTHADGVITGTLTVTPTNQVTVSFVVRVDFPGTLEQANGVANRACVYPFDGTLGGCVWSNEVSNPYARRIYLPLVVRNYTPIRADFTAYPTSGKVPLTVVFTNTSTGGYTASLWDFGDGITSTQTSPTHTYTTVEVYTVTLTVSRVSGTPVLPGDISTLVRPSHIVVKDNLPPDTPSNPVPATGAASQSVDVDLSWTGGDPDGDVVTYTVYLEAGDDTPDVEVSAAQSSATYDPGTLIADTHYYWQVVATDERGETTAGPVWDFTTSAEVPPVAPSHLQATPISSSQIGLTWQDNSSDETGFAIYDGSIWVANVQANTVTYTVGGLEPESYHCFRVYAYNDHGNSAWSDWACGTTSPSEVSCIESIANGGFENDSDWVIPVTVYPATYTAAITRTGNRALRVGIVESGDNRESYSSARQTVTIPDDVVSATLRFWLYPVSGETPANLTIPAHPLAYTIEEAVLASDRQYVIVLNEHDQWINTLIWQRKNDQEWMIHQFDLSVYAGRTIKLQFGAYNDGWDGVTALYVDDVSLELCTAATRMRLRQERYVEPGVSGIYWIRVNE